MVCPYLVLVHYCFFSLPMLPSSNLLFTFFSCVNYIYLLRLVFQVTIDIPYASPPQGMKYFTIIGPHIDCMDEQYLVRVASNVLKLHTWVISSAGNAPEIMSSL